MTFYKHSNNIHSTNRSVKHDIEPVLFKPVHTVIFTSGKKYIQVYIQVYIQQVTDFKLAVMATRNILPNALFT